MEPCLQQFRHVKRYQDATNNCISAKILPGEFYVTTNKEMVTTVLGSCVAACIYDPSTGIGGMNHFMLPGADDQRSNSAFGDEASARYGLFAMEGLINAILKCGVRRENLRAKLFGGGRILANMSDVGKKNIRFVKDFLRAESMPVESTDLGLIYPRKVNFFPHTGKAQVKRLRTLHNTTIIDREKSYSEELAKTGITGDVELF